MRVKAGGDQIGGDGPCLVTEFTRPHDRAVNVKRSVALSYIITFRFVVQV